MTDVLVFSKTAKGGNTNQSGVSEAEFSKKQAPVLLSGDPTRTGGSFPTTIRDLSILLMIVLGLAMPSGAFAQSLKTTTTITASGSPGNYTLTTTVTGIGTPAEFPTGSVSFHDTSNGNALVGTVVLGAPTFTQGFLQKPSPSTGTGPIFNASGDFNNDGNQDLVVVNATAKTP